MAKEYYNPTFNEEAKHRPHHPKNKEDFELAIINSMSDSDTIKRIVVHCSATYPNQDIGRDEIHQMHLNRGWSGIGYHYVIRKSGAVELGRDHDNDGVVTDEIGAHVKGFNKDSIGIVYVGGLDDNGKGIDTRTDEQVMTLRKLIHLLKSRYPNAEVLGHRDLSPDTDGDGVVESHEWLKLCPCFDAKEEYKNL